MSFFKNGITTVMGFALLSALATAQTLTVTPGSGLKAGETATIQYNNPNMPNQQVTVTVSGGWPIPITQSVVIDLDAKGRGTGSWLVASWMSAHFNAPGVHELTLAIRS